MKLKKLIPTLLAVVIFSAFLCGCGAQKQIIVSDEKTDTEVTVKAKATVEDILAAAGITLGEKDEVIPALTEIPADGTQVRVSRLKVIKIVTADGKTVTAELTGETVADALKAAGLTLAEGEKLNVSEDALLSELEDGIVISLQTAVNLTADGETKSIFTSASTVKEFLEEQKLTLADEDIVTPELDSKIEDGTDIVVKRVTVKTEIKKETIKFDTEKEYSASLAKGKSQTKREGSNGEKEVTYEITLIDGVEDSRKVISENITKTAVSEIIVYGTYVEASVPVTEKPAGKTVVSKEAVPDCDGSGHGYYVITYSDGSVEYEDY